MGATARRGLTYTAVGFGVDAGFSTLHDLARKRPVRWRTSAWMLPVYALLLPLYEPLHDELRDKRMATRAASYGAGFLAVEYATGRLFRRLRGDAPWDYSDARFDVHGLIRLDYFFLWAAFGLALERLHDGLVQR